MARTSNKAGGSSRSVKKAKAMAFDSNRTPGFVRPAPLSPPPFAEAVECEISTFERLSKCT